jgi:hypothetical protein
VGDLPMAERIDTNLDNEKRKFGEDKFIKAEILSGEKDEGYLKRRLGKIR